MQVNLKAETFIEGYSRTKAAVENGAFQQALQQAAATFKNSPDQNSQLGNLLQSFKDFEVKYNQNIAPALSDSIKLYEDMRERTEHLKALDLTQALAAGSSLRGPKMGDASGIRG